MSLNGYGYVEGNPVTYTDPSGEIPLVLLPLGGAIIGGALEFVRQASIIMTVSDPCRNVSLLDVIQNLNGDQILRATGAGALIGTSLAIATSLGAIVATSAVEGAIYGAITGGISNTLLGLASDVYAKKEYTTIDEFVERVSVDFMVGAVFGGIGAATLDYWEPVVEGAGQFRQFQRLLARASAGGIINVFQGATSRHLDYIYFGEKESAGDLSYIASDYIMGSLPLFVFDALAHQRASSQSRPHVIGQPKTVTSWKQAYPGAYEYNQNVISFLTSSEGWIFNVDLWSILDPLSGFFRDSWNYSLPPNQVQLELEVQSE
jgi:hypothetical protein